MHGGHLAEGDMGFTQGARDMGATKGGGGGGWGVMELTHGV